MHRILTMLTLSTAYQTPDAEGGADGGATDATTTVETPEVDIDVLVRPPALTGMLQEANSVALAAWLRSDPHYEAVFRGFAEANGRVEAGSTDQTDNGYSMIYRMLCMMGPAMAGQFKAFEKPKVAAAKGEKIPTWTDAARHLFAKVECDAVYGTQSAVLEALRSGKDQTVVLTLTIKARTHLGLPNEISDGESFFLETLKATGSPYTALTVDEREYPGMSKGMLGKDTQVQFGWYANMWRHVSEKKPKEVVTEGVAATPGAAPASPAPAPTAEVPAGS